jgi:hypothetical protein
MKIIHPLTAAVLVIAACGLPPENESQSETGLAQSQEALTVTCASVSTGGCANLSTGTVCGSAPVTGTCQTVFALGKPSNFCECVVAPPPPPPPPRPTCPTGTVTVASCRGIVSGTACGRAGGHCTYHQAPACNPTGEACAVSYCSCQ